MKSEMQLYSCLNDHFASGPSLIHLALRHNSERDYAFATQCRSLLLTAIAANDCIQNDWRKNTFACYN
jgi:hypothetical protein